MQNEPEKLAWSGCRLLFVDYNDEQSRISLCYFDFSQTYPGRRRASKEA